MNSQNYGEGTATLHFLPTKNGNEDAITRSITVELSFLMKGDNRAVITSWKCLAGISPIKDLNLNDKWIADYPSLLIESEDSALENHLGTLWFSSVIFFRDRAQTSP